MTAYWEALTASFEQTLLPRPPFGFLRAAPVRRTMFVGAGGPLLSAQLRLLRATYSQRELRRVLTEDIVGTPPIVLPRYRTSRNAVHHLAHLTEYSTRTGVALDDVATVVEWGGGYGSLARLFVRLAKESTYVVVDIPIMSCLQWIYLASILGTERVNLLTTRDDAIRQRVVNLLPLSLLEHHQLHADLFISTWALSECDQSAQRYVVDRDWFGAERLLLAYQQRNDQFAAADLVGALARESGATITEINQMPGNFYAFL